LIAVVLMGALAAPAQATVRKGNGTDPSGDTANAGNDVIAFAAQADDETGRVAAAIGLKGAPASYVVALVGTQRGTDCVAPFVLFTGHPASRVAVYGRDTATSTSDFKPASMQVDGATVAFGAEDAAQLKVPFDCAIVGTSSDGGTSNVYDETARLDLVPDAPPAATPTPTPTPAPTVAPQPATTQATTAPVAVPVAKLSATLGAPPSRIKRNRSITLKLALKNDGTKPTGTTTVTIASARGLKVARRKIKVAKLKPAQQRTVKLKVKLTRRSAKLKVTARSGKLKAKTSLLLKVGKARKRPPAPATKQSPLVGTYWWRTVTHVDYAWDNRALYFVDDKSVYSGFPKGGLPTACTTAPAEPGEEYDTQEGCLPYTYDERSGAITVGGKTGTFKPGGKLVIDGEDYDALQIPAANARYGYNELRHWAFSGYCGLISGCTVTKDYFTLTPDGQFVLSHSFTSTIGDPNAGPYTAVGSYPPGERGTYTVLAGGRIHLAFADGTVRDETFALTSDGVMLGEDNFYPDTD
jgi:hypothetical protein